MSDGRAVCPWCGERLTPQGLDGHIRLCHLTEPGAVEYLAARRTSNLAARAAELVEKLTPDFPQLEDSAVQLRRVAEDYREQMQTIVDQEVRRDDE